uniref:Serine/threonine-protein phosphatase 2A activator n=1 Tax=Equus caballus TaxID=9796 RepID=F7BZJ8_HORSE
EKESHFLIPREGLGSRSSQVSPPGLVSWGGDCHLSEGQAQGPSKLGGLSFRSLLCLHRAQTLQLPGLVLVGPGGRGACLASLSEVVILSFLSCVPRRGFTRAYADYIGFILTLNEGVKGKKLTFEYTVSEAIEKLVALLNTLDRWIDETPPVDQPSRFGNKAYRTWYAKLDQEAESLVATVVPTHLAAAVPEVAVYLKESVGNSTRIDYGTGHEAAFAAFLCCLCKIGVLRVDDQIAIVFKVFNRYLEVMRKLQKTYRMEPAGSQGVWGLDDFQFLPFIWGSSQLIDHPYLEPRHFVDEKAVNENHKDYMFLECILFITEMKTGPFAEHSNQLWNISAVPSWSKVNQGLIRMYKAECLEKFPVIQHFKFGSLLPIHPVTSS